MHRFSSDAIFMKGKYMEENTVKKIEVAEVEELLLNHSDDIIVQVAPAVRVALGEMFSLKVGTNVEKKMISALRKLGFKHVFDTDFGADITIDEEASEFLSRVKNNSPYFPMFSSCCIGWVNSFFIQGNDLINHISTTKSPLGCFGSLAKKYYAKKYNKKVEDIIVLSIVPCILKKNESKMPYNKTDDIFDVDYTWTTKDLGQLLIERNIDLPSLDDSDFDNPLGSSSGGGKIFGRIGGVLESLIRAIYYYEEGKVFDKRVEFTTSTISPDIKEVKLNINNREYLFANCSIIGARKLIEMTRNHTCPYHFVEVMACAGGCIMGAGQPSFKDTGLQLNEVKEARMSALNLSDDESSVKCSPLNDDLNKLYDYLNMKPFDQKSENYLHRDYIKYGKH